MRNTLKFIFVFITVILCISLITPYVYASETQPTGPSGSAPDGSSTADDDEEDDLGTSTDSSTDSDTDSDTDTDTDTDTTVEYTDFSEAKFEFVKDGISMVNLKISNIQLNEKSTYYIYIGATQSAKPSSDLSELTRLSMNKDEAYLYAYRMEKYVELNQDIYLSIYEQLNMPDAEKHCVLSGVKVEKLAQPEYADAFGQGYVCGNGTLIPTGFTHAEENVRTLNLKIGIITDNDILNQIKNNQASGWANLKTYAKNNQAVFKTSKTINDANIMYWTQTGDPVINLSEIVDDAYYYVYVEVDDENGKFIEQSAVTFGVMDDIRSVGEESWWIFLYGSDDFNWDNLSSGDTNNGNNGQQQTPGDNTGYQGNRLPQTGVTLTLAFATIGVIAGAVVFARKSKKYTL